MAETRRTRRRSLQRAVRGRDASSAASPMPATTASAPRSWSRRRRDFGVPFMAIAIMISTFGCVNGMILMGARLYYAMARDGLFFQSVGTLNERGVPAVGLILQGLWSILLIFSGTLQRAARLRHLRGAALLRADGASACSSCAASSRTRSGRTGRSATRCCRRCTSCCAPSSCVALLVVKPVYTWPGFLHRPDRHPGLFPVARQGQTVGRATVAQTFCLCASSYNAVRTDRMSVPLTLEIPCELHSALSRCWC